MTAIGRPAVMCSRFEAARLSQMYFQIRRSLVESSISGGGDGDATDPADMASPFPVITVNGMPLSAIGDLYDVIW